MGQGGLLSVSSSPPAPAGSPAGPTSRRAVEVSMMFLLAFAAIMALLIGMIAFSVIRRRWIGGGPSRPKATRLPDPWREAARRMGQSPSPPPPINPEEEPLQ